MFSSLDLIVLQNQMSTAESLVQLVVRIICGHPVFGPRASCGCFGLLSKVGVDLGAEINDVEGHENYVRIAIIVRSLLSPAFWAVDPGKRTWCSHWSAENSSFWWNGCWSSSDAYLHSAIMSKASCCRRISNLDIATKPRSLPSLRFWWLVSSTDCVARHIFFALYASTLRLNTMCGAASLYK